MTNRERENCTLSFIKPQDRGAVEETFYPWTLTLKRFEADGIPGDIVQGLLEPAVMPEVIQENDKYFNVCWSDNVLNYEKHLGFDPVRRISFMLPFGEYSRKVACEEDWKGLIANADKVLERSYTRENLEKAYGHLKEGHERGDYSIRMNIEGFFWTARELMGIEPHMYAFYDFPELLHDINEHILGIYLQKLSMLLDIVSADVLYIMEDLSGKNGPMISPDKFDEFIGSYYKRLIPMLKSKGVRHVFVDTDGDFRKLVPNFIKAGIDGFLPMDVNAGIDIVEIRKQYPELKFIGGFNKLCIAEGRAAIDREFERLLPVIRQGGYIPGCDHQVAPSTPLENYTYYIGRLKEIMVQACTEAGSK